MEDDLDFGSLMGGSGGSGDMLSSFMGSGGDGSSSMLSGGDDSSSMVSPYPSSAVPAVPPGQVSPYPQGATDPAAIDPALKTMMNMLGMAQQQGGASPAPNTAPMPAGNVQTAAGPLPAGSFSPLLQLGPIGQKSQQVQWLPPTNNVSYSAPPNPSTSSTGGGLMGKGIGGLTGNASAGATGSGVGRASVPITAFFGGF